MAEDRLGTARRRRRAGSDVDTHERRCQHDGGVATPIKLAFPWTFPLGAALRPRWPIWRFGFALTFVVVAVLLFSDRDLAPIFGHLSPLAGAR